MARVYLSCGCGHTFFVSSTQVEERKPIECPACAEPVKAPAQASAGAPGAPAKAPAPPRVPVRSPKGPGRKLLLPVIAGGSAFLLLLLVGGYFAFRTPAVDPEVEAQRALAARKKAFEAISRGASPEAPPVPPAAAAPDRAPAAVRSSAPQAPSGGAPLGSPSAAPKPPAFVMPKVQGAAAPGQPLAPELLARLSREVLTLHPFYLALVLEPAEKARVEAAVSTGRGSLEDAEFFQTLLASDRWKAVRSEVAQIAQSAAVLERDSLQILPVDRITLLEGARPMDCRILEETPEAVKISRAYAAGVGGQMVFPRERIRTIEKGKGIGAEFSGRWEASKSGSVADLVALLGWCKEHTMPGQAKLVAFTILRTDPSNPQARQDAGLPPDPVKNADELARGGVIMYQGKAWNAKELKDKFQKDGYSLINGQWFGKKDKMISIPGLFRYEHQAEKTIVIGGAAQVCQDVDIVYKSVTESGAALASDVPDVRPLRRFYAPPMGGRPTQTLPPGAVIPSHSSDLDLRIDPEEGVPPAGTVMRADVTLNVPVGAPILEASVLTTADVKAGGSIVVSLIAQTPEGVRRTRLYACESKENTSHPIPAELIRGQSEVNLVIEIEETAAYSLKIDRHRVKSAAYKGKFLVSPAVDIIHYRQVPEWKAVLFPSNANTIEVFRLRVSIADPAPEVDKIFAANPEVLR